MLSWEYPPHAVGGMGRHVQELAPALVAQGVEVDVITPALRGGPESEVVQGVQVFRVPAAIRGIDDLAEVQRVNDLLSAAALQISATRYPDLIHTHDWLTAQAGFHLKHAWMRPLIATIHATERGRGQGYLVSEHSTQIDAIEWALNFESWRVIACSQFMADQVHQFFQTPTDKIRVVANGVTPGPSPFRNEQQRLEFRRRFARDSQHLAFYVGRLVYEKGVQTLLDAWPKVLLQVPNARLVIAGTGIYQDALWQQAQKLQLDNAVTFAGFISDSDRDRLYHAADLAIFPSIYEPFGIVALEAMAARCPVVVSRAGGLAEVVRDHETGMVALPNDPHSLAWAILHSFKHEEWTEARAENALREVWQVYIWDKIAAATKQIYQETLEAWKVSGWGTT